MQGLTVLNGGAGFIGSALARSLVEAGEPVRVVDTPRRLSRARPWLADPRVELVERDPDLRWLKTCRNLVHLAWSSIPSSSMENPGADVTNVTSAIDLFQASADAEIECIVFASSGGAVYGNVTGLANEDTVPAPLSPYGINKLCVEHYLSLYTREHKVAGYSLRIANPYGPYQLLGTPVGVIANFVARTLQGKPIEIWGDGTVARDFIHIADVVRAVVAILQARPLPGCYNVGSGCAHSLREIATIVRRISGRAPQIRYLEGRGFDVLRVALDTSRLRAAVGWEPKIELFKGVRALMNQATDEYLYRMDEPQHFENER